MKTTFIEIQKVEYNWSEKTLKDLPKTTVNINCIHSLDENHQRGACSVTKLTLIGGEVIFVRPEEGTHIKDLMLDSNKKGKDPLAEEISNLTHAVRDLWNLLRSRLH